MKVSRVGIGALLFVAAARAQAAAPPYDVSRIIQGLDSPASHDSALAKLKAVPLPALVPLWQVAVDKATSAQVRIDLTDAFPIIYARLQADRKKHEMEVDNAWTKANTLDAYNKAARKNPKWDALAAAALTDVSPTPSGIARLKAAIDAGCDDPLIRYYYTLRSMGTVPQQIPSAQGIPMLYSAARDMDASKYPDGRKLYAYGRFLSWSLLPTAPPEITNDMRREALDRMLALLPSIPAENAGDVHMRELVDIIEKAAIKLYPGAKPSNDKIIPAIKAAFPNSYIVDQVNAAFLIEYAWEARGNGRANTVLPEQFKVFDDRLQEAATTARHGWELNPLMEKCATSMIVISMGHSLDRSTMESWYQRAILANPDSLDACSAKYTYLLPKWFGSEQETYAFARECVQTGNAKNRIPRIMIAAVLELRTQSGDPNAYMAQPAVWRDLKSAFDKLLADKNDLKTDGSNYRYNRAEYMKYAAEFKQWQTLLDLMNEYSNEFDLKTFGGQELYDLYKQQATAELKKIAI